MKGLSSLWEGSTFLPNDLTSRSDLLREKVWKSREAAFVAFGLKLSVREPELYRETEFADFFRKFRSLPSPERRQIIESPLFLIWLSDSVGPYSSQVELRDRLSELRRVMVRFKQALPASHVIRYAGSSIRVGRFDVDPLIVRAASPEYEFPNLYRQREFQEEIAYPLSFFLEMVTLALERIKRAWPQAHREFFKFVKIIVDMIDGECTSYSGRNHMGVIFVSTDNSPLVALEEYLMHEFGHQILYHVMELDPLVLTENKQTFKLPWSENERDFYGYFHAFFIYILLAHYLERVTGRSQREQSRVAARSSHIIKGLVRATLELESADSFTPRGRQLFRNLKKEVYHLVRAGKSPLVHAFSLNPTNAKSSGNVERLEINT